LETVALILAVAEVCKEVGGACVNAMVIGATIATEAETVVVGLAWEAAIIFTVLPVGTEAGAV
jgi:hypothetical protein